MSSRAKKIVLLGRKLNDKRQLYIMAELDNESTLVQPGHYEILPHTKTNPIPEDLTCSKGFSEPPLNTADRVLGHKAGPEVIHMEGECSTTSFSIKLPQEYSGNNAVNNLELQETEILQPAIILQPISGNELSEDLDYSTSSSDNYESSSGSSETDSVTLGRNSDHEQESHSD